MKEPTKPDRYRNQAATCRIKAQESTTAEAKAQFEDMARQWDDLADQLERGGTFKTPDR